MISVDFIIVNYKSTEYLIKCIDSIYSNISSVDINIFIEDNETNHCINKLERRYRKVRIRKNKKNLGFGAAVNNSLQDCKSQIVVVLNPDTVLYDESLVKAIHLINHDSRIGIIGPRIYECDGTIQGSARKFPTPWTSIFGRKSPLTKIFPNNPITKKEFMCFNCDSRVAIDVDWVSGACMVIRREALNQIGGFDERFFLYWEDTDLCKRVREAGWSVVYYPESRIVHLVGKSSQKRAIRSIFHFHRSCFFLFVKHSKAPMNLLMPLAFAGLTARCIFVMVLHVINRTLSKFSKHKTFLKINNIHTKNTSNETININYSKPKILFINQYYPPDRSATAGVLERIVEFLSDSFYFTVLAGRPSYLSLERHNWKPIDVCKQERGKIIHVGSFAYPRKNKLFRSINYLSYFFIASLIAPIIKTDLIIAMTDPPISGIIGAIVSIIKRKPFVYYIQDLHPEMAIASGMIGRGSVTKLWDIIHKLVMQRADKIMAIGDDMRDRIKNKKIPGSKIVVIRHGAAKYPEPVCLDDIIINKIRKPYKFTFMHAGNIGYYGAWENTIDAFKEVRNRDIGFIFVGEGQKKKMLMSRSQKSSNIKFINYQPREKVQSVLKSADVHIITIKKGLEGLIVPSKIYPILSAHKPILAICPETSDIARIIKRFECGLVVDPDSPQKIIEAVIHFYEKRNKLNTYCENSKKASEYFNQIGQLNILKQEITDTILT